MRKLEDICVGKGSERGRRMHQVTKLIRTAVSSEDEKMLTPANKALIMRSERQLRPPNLFKFPAHPL